MAFQTLTWVAVVFSLLFFNARLGWTNTPRDAESFEKRLKYLKRKPGPMGYFNSKYMAFNLTEAEQFPNLVFVHSQMRRIKTIIAKLRLEEYYALNNTQISTRNKRGSTYPQTKITGLCSTTIAGLQRLCEVCPAMTDLGPDIIPRFINEVLCAESDGGCEIEGVNVGKCQEASVIQDFLRVSTLEVFAQEIRVCCNCNLL